MLSDYDKLVEKIKKQNAPVVVGLDPMMKFVPKHLQEKAFKEYGETLEGAAEAIWQFNKEIVDSIYECRLLSHRWQCMNSLEFPE